MRLADFDIESLISTYKKGDLSPVDVAKSCLELAESSQPKLNAYLQLDAERTLAIAKDLETKRDNLSQYPLFGVPIAIKDNFLVDGWQATAGSKILEGYISPYTATSVERLVAAGALIIGKTNLDEFAMGSSNENSAYGDVKNPWDTKRVPGGSSGGSAVAIAAQTALGALGTDTGGSIRQPASFCGVVGLKPTYGRVSRYGVIAFASSLDQVGPFGKTTKDVALQLEVMAGYDRYDATSSRAVVPKYRESLEKGQLKNAKLGVSKEWLESGLDESILRAFEQVLDTVKQAGAHIVDVSLPHSKYALSTYYLIAPSEASSNLARYDGVHYGFRALKTEDLESVYAKSRGEGFRPEVKLRIMLGTYALSAGYYDAYYKKANQVRALIQKDFLEAFETCDAILMPTSPSTAFEFGEKAKDPIKMYASDICTLPVSLAGLPALSVPCGLDEKKLPIGVQFIGRHFDESRLFGLAHAYEAFRGPFPLAGDKS